ncbi:glycosyltransferase family 2 protein [Bacillus sinesaloumensis]|uniref:glycosyltransferase family 2 protein n=1 Tax=Litchfieldia sinesaloumensis TaxID=1926280 RepID=UPI0009884204|nr:glycosyltransferase family 2 protein [Bacillus sinesaloumensis]
MNNFKRKSVAIILLNWNAYNDSFECLKSLENLDYPSYSVFLVDNDSQDDSFVKLKADYQIGKFNINITFIQSGGNIGFAGGNNVAIEKAYKEGFSYFWLLNNDTTVEKSALTKLVDEIEHNSKIGIVGSKILYYGTNKIWFAGGKLNTISGFTKHVGFEEEDKGQFDKIREVDYITGCSLLFKQELLEKVGFLPEDYFLYFEETDWNIKVSKNGFKILFVPESIVYHKVSSSSGGDKSPSPFIPYYFLRNRYVMIKRNGGLISQKLGLIFLFIPSVKYIAKVLLLNQNNKIKRLKYIFLGISDGIKGKMGSHPLI